MTSKCIVVLGMHGGGTSLVASLLDAVGVDMNPNPNAKVKGYLNYEDTSFVRLNARVLAKAGGDWCHPPDRAKILSVYDEFKSDIVDLVTASSKRSSLWGWKDPRSALTIGLFVPHLPGTHYIHVTRNTHAIVRSIISRGPTPISYERWVGITDRYYDDIDGLLRHHVPAARQFHIAFEDLTDNRELSTIRLRQLVKFLMLPQSKVELAMNRIKFKS